MSALTTAILLSAVAVVLFGGRRTALLGLIAGAIILTRGDFLVIGGLSMYPTRLLMLAGFVRVAVRGELSQFQWNAVDRTVLVAYVYCMAIFVLRTVAGYGTVDVAQVSVTDRVGTVADVALAYLAIRSMLKDSDDLLWLFSALVLLLIPYVGLLIVERTTGVNPFAAIGGADRIWSEPGRLRCRGSFMHPSLLGTFGACLVPMYAGIILSRKRVFIAALGLLCALTIVTLANSGGPWIFVAATIAAWALWPVRRHMRAVRYGILAMFVALAIVMKAPIWYLPSKVSDLAGGDGWHRSYLMDQTIGHFRDWWLAGMPLHEAREWFPYLVNGGLDITNLFVAFGLDSGLLGMGLLIAIFVVGFSRLGEGLREQRAIRGSPKDAALLYWALGAALVGHLVNFFAITYFDQTYVLWLFLLGAIASLPSVTVSDGSAVPAAKPIARSFVKGQAPTITAEFERQTVGIRQGCVPPR